MTIKPGLNEADFLHAVQTWASQQTAFLMPTLEVGKPSDFLALRLTQSLVADHPLRRLADACVLDSTLGAPP